MAIIIDDFVPSATYNELPSIKDVAKAPDVLANELETLRELLAKHQIPKEVCIRLIHKHFDALEGEVMVFDKLDLPQGTVKIMKPMVPSEVPGLRGLHYFVNPEGSLQAYEYTRGDVFDVSGMTAFIQEFCQVVSEKGLQHVFGLKLKDDGEENVGMTEFEIHEKRSTVMIPDGMPVPEGDFDFTVNTEWVMPEINKLTTTCRHQRVCAHGPSKCSHCSHCRNHEALSHGEGLFLGGQEIEPGTALHQMVGILVAAI